MGRTRDQETAEEDVAARDPSGAANANPHKTVTKTRRSLSIERDSGLVRQQRKIAYPKSAAFCIDEATFYTLDVHCQRAIAALAAAPTLFALGADTFGKDWQWDAGSAPLRNIGQRGKWRERDKQDDREFFSSFDDFQRAFSFGALDDYMTSAVAIAKQQIDAAAANCSQALELKNQTLDRLRKQSDQALLVACHSMMLSMRKDHPDLQVLQEAFNAITAIAQKPEQLATLREFVPEANRRAIVAFVTALVRLLDEVRAGAMGDEQELLDRNSLLKTFYGIVANLLGFSLEQLAQLLARHQGKDEAALLGLVTNRSSTLLNLLCNGDRRFAD